jgi:hypothetical protein
MNVFVYFILFIWLIQVKVIYLGKTMCIRPDKEDFGRIFYGQGKMRSKCIAQGCSMLFFIHRWTTFSQGSIVMGGIMHWWWWWFHSSHVRWKHYRSKARKSVSVWSTTSSMFLKASQASYLFVGRVSRSKQQQVKGLVQCRTGWRNRFRLSHIWRCGSFGNTWRSCTVLVMCRNGVGSFSRRKAVDVTPCLSVHHAVVIYTTMTRIL